MIGALGVNLTAEQRIQKATLAIMQHPEYVAMAGVLMIGTKTVRDDVPTACTNGRDEFYGRAFVDSMNDPELRFLMIHEAKHKLRKHLTLYKYLYDKDAQLGNTACDYLINGETVRAHAQDKFATMTGPLAGGCFDPKYDSSWDEERIFNDLQQQQQNDPQGGGGSGSGQGEPFDEHDWDGAAELTDEEQKDLAKQIDEALREGVLAASKMGGQSSLSIAELLKPQVNWRDVLREFVTATCKGNDYGTWAKPNRRFVGAGVYMPSPISEKVEELVIAIDTSGSVRRHINAFLTEVVAVCRTVKPSRVRVLYWDSSVAGDECYEEDEVQTLVQHTKPMGGGGTDVVCVPAHMKEHNISPQAVVVLTDGDLYGGWGQWSCPVLWCVLNNPRATPDVGKVLHIKHNAI